VDHIVSSTLNGIGHATAACRKGSPPLSGLLDGLRAGIGSFRRKRTHQRHSAATSAHKSSRILTKPVRNSVATILPG